MMKSLHLSVIFGISILLFNCNREIKVDLPLDDYKKEIQALNKEDYYRFWEELNSFDQNVVLGAKDYKVFDSLSLVTLIKSALFYELKGDSIFLAPNTYNEFFFIHNQIPKANLDFWPLLIKQKEITGNVLMYPSYQLEGLTGSFYDYSVFGQDSIYDTLLAKIKPHQSKSLSDALVETYLETKRLQKFSVIDQVGIWHRQRFKDGPIDPKLGDFELLKLSDNNLYLRFNEARFIPLDIIDTNDEKLIFETKYEPFGWYYVHNDKGDLSLYNEKDILLVTYTKA